jgi:predicted dehydrogenase
VARTTTLRLVACADPDQEAAAKVAAGADGVRPFPSVEALLDAGPLDAVIVATPHDVLCPVSLTAIRAGAHVLAEKPVGLNEQEAVALQQEAGRAGVRYMAGYSCRFFVARHVHDLLAAGTVGEIQAITGIFACEPINHGWLASTERGGGPLLFLGSHLVDMLLWFIDDEPVETAGMVRRRPGSDIDETSSFQLRFSRGALAQCLVTQAASTFYFGVDIHGDAGRATLRGWSFTQFEIEVSSAVNATFSEPTLVRPRAQGDHITTILVPELEEFACCILEGREPSITATDARRVLRVLGSVVTADKDRAPVSLV